MEGMPEISCVHILSRPGNHNPSIQTTISKSDEIKSYQGHITFCTIGSYHINDTRTLTILKKGGQDAAPWIPRAITHYSICSVSNDILAPEIGRKFKGWFLASR
jgi:hypothetical protein